MPCGIPGPRYGSAMAKRKQRVRRKATKVEVAEHEAVAEEEPKPKRSTKKKPAEPAQSEDAVFAATVRGLGAEAAEAQHEWLNAKAEAAELKKVFDGVMGRLLAATLSDGDDAPLLQHMEPDGWRKEPLRNIFARDDDVEKLEMVSGGSTLGHLSDWLNKSRDGFQSLSGWGPARAAKLEEQLDEFWRKNPQWLESAEETDDSSDTDEE